MVEQTLHDASEWPIVIDVPPPNTTEQDVRDYIARHDGYLARKEPYGAILDLRRAQMMGPRQRRIVADWITARRQELRAYHAAVALVIASPLTRGFVAAVYWLSPPPYPYKLTSTIDEARAWVRTQIARKVTSEDRPPA